MIRPMITSMVNPGESGRLVYDFDGIDDYIVVPTVNLVAGDTVKIKFTSPVSIVPSNSFIIYSSTQNTGGRVFVNAAGVIIATNYISVMLDGGTDLTVPLDGGEHELTMVATSATNELVYIGTRATSISDHIYFPLYDLDITAVSGNRFYPIDDGFGVNPLIADTLGGQDGAANNFNASRWINV